MTHVNDTLCEFEQWGVLIDEGNKSYSKGLLSLTLKSYRQALELIISNSKMLLRDSDATFMALGVSIKNISIASSQLGKDTLKTNAYRVAAQYLKAIIEDMHQLPRIRNSANEVFNKLMYEWDCCIECYSDEVFQEQQTLMESKRYQKQLYH